MFRSIDSNEMNLVSPSSWKSSGIRGGFDHLRDKMAKSPQESDNKMDEDSEQNNKYENSDSKSKYLSKAPALDPRPKQKAS